MPFVTQPLRVSNEGQPPFVGRAAEQRFFRQQILAPDEPGAHLLNVWGPPGTGVSTLLLRWREEARAAPLDTRPLTAFAEGRVASPLRAMTAYAAQLRAVGAPLLAFEQLLEHVTTLRSVLSRLNSRLRATSLRARYRIWLMQGPCRGFR